MKGLVHFVSILVHIRVNSTVSNGNRQRDNIRGQRVDEVHNLLQCLAQCVNNAEIGWLMYLVSTS